MVKDLNPDNITKDFFVDILWILDKESGLCIFEKKFNKSFNDPNYSADLISGFFSAIMKFFYTIFSERIQNIQFYDSTLNFKITKNLVFVARFNKKKKLSESKIDKIISKIIKSFYKEFHESIEFSEIYYKKSKLSSFSEELERIVENFSSPQKLLSLL